MFSNQRHYKGLEQIAFADGIVVELLLRSKYLWLLKENKQQQQKHKWPGKQRENKEKAESMEG